LPEGRIWIGDGNTIVSDTVYVDEPNNRVGIGTTTPSTDLEVSSTGVNGVDISQSASNASQSGRLFFTTNTASEGFALFNSNGTFQVNSGGIPNNTSGTNRISIIGSTGNVGIGTTSPSFVLDVANGINDNDVFRINGANADVLFSGNVTAPTGGVGLWNFINTGTNATTRFYVQDANNSNDRLTFRFTGNNGSNEVLAGTSFGNVGIGTTSPTRKLHVLGPGNSTPNLAGGILLQTSGGGGLDIYATSTAANPVFNFRTFSGEEISFSPNSTELMRLKGSGVGIGTTSPSYKLDVSGEGRFTGDLRCLSLIQTSQRDQKENINDIDKSKAKAIPFKEYTYKSSIDGSSRKRYGVVVEDIEDDYPELVHTDADGVKGVNYIDLLVKRVAELEKELEDISLIEGPKGDTGAAGGDGKDGNSHLSNITSIAFNPKAGRLEVNISGTVYNFVPSK